MSAADHLGNYAAGWTNGDTDTLLKSVSDGYVFDDPNAGKISKSELAEYVAGMKEMVRSVRGGSLPDPFLELTEVVTQEDGGVITAWAWWNVPGTEIKAELRSPSGDPTAYRIRGALIALRQKQAETIVVGGDSLSD